MSNPELPTWPGADEAYARAYRILAKMGANMPRTLRKKGRKTVTEYMVPDEMRDFAEALGKGDEERIKGLNLQYLKYDTKLYPEITPETTP